MKENCTFTSVWDGGIEIATPAIIDTDTGFLVEVTTTDGVVIGLETLEEEYITLDNGDQYKVCTDCHQAVIGNLGRWDDGHGNYIPKTGCPVCNHHHLVGGIGRWRQRH